MKKRWSGKVILLLVGVVLILFLSVRFFSHSEVDDVSPEIFCEQELLENADVLWVIPKFNNISISENPEWCGYILSLNKTIGLHGIEHSFNEFNEAKTQQEFEEAIEIFENCFNQTPTIFKPPQLIINSENKILIQENNLKLRGKFNQIFHKVYHCNDSGFFKNWVVRVF